MSILYIARPINPDAAISPHSAHRNTLDNPSNDRSLQRHSLLARPSLLRALGTIAVAFVLASCSDVLRVVGPSPAVAETHASQLFEAFATRFSPNEFGPRYELARLRLAQSALVPSRIFNDSAVWDGDGRPSPSLRALYVSGDPIDGTKYHLETRPVLTPPARPGETRHAILLEQLEPNVYRWDTRVDLALGSVTAEGIAGMFTALFASVEGKTETELQSEYRTAFPRATAAFGHGFTIDSIHIAPGGNGSTSAELTASFNPELMRAWYPELAHYLDKYLGPAKYHFSLTERSGAPLFDVIGANRSMVVRWRVHQGTLASLVGVPHPWPDTLVLTSDLTLRVKLFTVGFQGMVSQFVFSNTGHERAWSIVSQREPKWVLPLITERVLRSPLHRPFDGQGSLLRFAVRDSAGTQTVLSRRTRLDVQESAIMRFMGSLAAHAVGELDRRVEGEEDRFLRDGFVALQGDLRALTPRWRNGLEIESATKP